MKFFRSVFSIYLLHIGLYIFIHSDSIWTVFGMILNCREIDENNVSKACIVTVFKTIWKCRE